MKKYTYDGKTEEEALELGLDELGLTKDDVLYSKKEEQKGGLFKAKKIEVEIVKKSDINEFIKEYLIKLTTDMGFEVNAESKESDGILNITLFSDKNNLLIGRDGKNMHALTTIMKQILFNELGVYYKFNLDIGEYKLKKQKNLERLAYKLAKEVGKTKVDVKMDPMNSYERRIVHNALNDNRYVYTESFGEEPNRYVVIKPRND